MSSRDFSTDFEAAITAGKVRPVIFVEGEFSASGSPDQSFLRLWSGLGDFSWDGKTWDGAGELLRISPLEESAEVKAVGFNVELSGLPSSILSTALQNVRQGRAGRVWLGLMGREGYLDLPGVNGNYASTPDSAASSVTGDIDIRVHLAMADWTPAAGNVVFSKWSDSGSQRSWTLQINTAGGIAMNASVDGAAISAASSTAAISALNAYDDLWIRATRASSTGTVKFFTSTDGVTWTQLGSDRTTTSGALFDSTRGLQLGGVGNTPTSNATAYIYYAELRNGIDGTAVAVFDPSTDAHKGDTSFTSSATGEVWTINQSGTTRAEIAMDENHIIADPYLVRSGRMDYVSVQAGGDTTTITAQYEDRLVDLERSRERRYTDEDQQYEYSGDRGFEFVASLQDKQLIWGGPGAASSPIAIPSYSSNDDDSPTDSRGDYSDND